MGYFSATQKHIAMSIIWIATQRRSRSARMSFLMRLDILCLLVTEPFSNSISIYRDPIQCAIKRPTIAE
jgi:hypothetical protein